MATGGTIPSNRTQTVTFYNTCPIIEKDKNVYYVPRFSKTGATTGQTVKTAYLNAFEVVCPPSSAYSNINVSQWSPQDRTLVVRGNIDDFRAVTDEGACLNYFIITRTIYKNIGGTVSSKIFYYAFFITNVQQAGGGSVSITAEPDDFTNVFYLHNNKTLTLGDINSDYEPFNEKMTNVYVGRQHYNRVQATFNHYVYKTKWFIMDISKDIFFVNSVYNIKSYDELTDYGDFKCIKKPFQIGTVQKEYEFVSNSGQGTRLNLQEGTYRITTVGSQITIDLYLLNWASEEVWDYQPDNMKIFMNQIDSYKFKYQYRDDKYPVSPYDGEFTDEEKNDIENAESVLDLSLDLANKVITTCISYVVVETKSPEICFNYIQSVGATLSGATNYNARLISGEKINDRFHRPNPTICFPFLNIPKCFNHLATSINSFTVRLSIQDYQSSFREVDINLIFNIINSNAVADYLYGVYILNNVNIPRDIINIAYGNDKLITFTLKYIDENPYQTSIAKINNKNCYISGIKTNISDTSGIQSLQPNLSTSMSSWTWYYSNAGILINNIHSSDYEIELNVLGEIPNNLKDSYYDPVLESEPYSFYSISIFGNYELVFNKNRWYENSEVELTYIYTINGSVKLSYIPNYTVETKSYLYFNESLTFTLASSLPLLSSSYDTFVNQNRAQMKNQFAVADLNYTADIIQHAFLSGPSSVGKSATKGGWIGAVAETGNQLVEMVNETIDYYQSRKVISMNQKAKLADVGNAPDTLKQAGSEVIYDLKTGENFLFLNHYRIDDLSYNSISKLLERVGYQVNLYDNINAVNRVGWNYVQLLNFDWKPEVDIMVSQENRIREIFNSGVTLLHDKTYLTSGHNYEIILEGGN